MSGRLNLFVLSIEQLDFYENVQLLKNVATDLPLAGKILGDIIDRVITESVL